MLELPNFTPLEATHTTKALTRPAIETLDHLLIVAPEKPSAATLAELPQAAELVRLLARSARTGNPHATTRVHNARSTGITLAPFRSASTFATLSWAAKALRECIRDGAATLGITVVGLDVETERRVLESLLAAAHAAAFALPQYRSKRDRPASPSTIRLFSKSGAPDLHRLRAEALGNNVARWFTALPPNLLTASAYRRAVTRLVKPYGVAARFLGEPELKRLGAGAFLAVARGNETRDAGILQLRFRPRRTKRPPALALVGKGVLFDTGGTNLKSFTHMLDMHTDMQGSAVALGTLLALVELGVSYPIDAWLAITENRMAPNGYKPQDLVRAANGTTIQVIHTDAEGRMILADTLALAARTKPGLMIDYATLTGSCVAALTERYSGAFSNRRAANSLLIAAGEASGERIWPFPMDDDFDEALKSDVADIKQCAVDNNGDHILAARFLHRFVPKTIPWIHLDLSAGQHKRGLGHIPTDITGFGVRLSIEVLQGQAKGPEKLAAELAS